tara:strand:- start:180 stop:713 length:534 start_codon:yes stop_codon:yes gene_type:complete
MKYPFHQKESNGRLIREFSADVASDELVWHRDRADRHVKVRSGEGWQLQLENRLPKNLIPGEIYFIPKNTYHRVIKGRQRLVVEIEENAMKITRRQLRRIIREAISSPDQDKRMYDVIIDILPMRGDAISGRELVDAVNQELPDIDAEMIYNFLDELLEDDVVNFDVEMDEWSLRTR